jgi:aspartate/methionine/tyrosine aminotransferase
MREAVRMRSVQTPIIPVVAEWIRQCPGTISLGQGVVSYPPPPEAVAAISTFLGDPENHKYKPVVGLPALLRAFQEKLASENGIHLGSTSKLVITAGSNMGFMNAVLAVTDPGDEVILQTPYYFNHEMAVAMASCRPVLVATDDDYQLRIGAIREAITPRTRAVVTISPNNPTGAVYSESALSEVNLLCRAHGIHHIHDEAYEYFVYGKASHFSPGSITNAGHHTISLFSLSKSYGFASWRVGAMVIPERLLQSVRKIQDTIAICAPVISQFAAVGALQAGAAYCREKLQAIGEVRDKVLKELTALPSICEVPATGGAFYFLLRVNTELNSLQVAERLIRQHGVAVIPGTAFGLEHGCYLRIAYGALESDTATEGINRLINGLKKLVLL